MGWGSEHGGVGKRDEWIEETIYEGNGWLFSFEWCVLFLNKREPVSQESLRIHIMGLMNKKGFVFKKPKTVDVDRLNIFESLQAWWHNPDIRKAILNTDPHLLFNADETGLNRKDSNREKVACKPDENPTSPLVISSRGDHVSLFPIISASGDLVKPYVVLHCLSILWGLYSNPVLQVNV